MAAPQSVRILVVAVAFLAAACSQSETRSAGDCPRGTLGIEPGDMSREFREKHRVPPDMQGAAVAMSMQDGPEGLAGVHKDDVLLEIAGKPVGNSCDAIGALFDGGCEPVTVVVWRNAARLPVKITPKPEKELLEQKCREGIAAACFRQGWLLWNGYGVEADHARALEIYRQACSKGWPDACAFLGSHLQDFGAAPDEVVSALKRSCDLGSARGCADLAYLYATGTLVEQDDGHATTLYVRSCDLGDSLGCYNVGVMFNNGRGVARDVQRAIAAYGEGCRGGSAAACTDLGWFYQEGQGVAKDEVRAIELYRRGCNGTKCQPPNRRGCVNLAIAYRDGAGVAAEPSRAASLLRTACESDVDTNDPDGQDSRSHACSLLGAMYLEGRGVAFDHEFGRTYSERGCRGRNALGCYNSAIVFARGLGVEADMPQAAKFYQLACDYEDGEACGILSGLYASGTGVNRNETRAKELAKRACSLGFASACE